MHNLHTDKVIEVSVDNRYSFQFYSQMFPRSSRFLFLFYLFILFFFCSDWITFDVMENV